MGQIVVISGTDIEVGKTFVGAAIGKALSERGVRVVSVKPVESGCFDEKPAPNEDGSVLAKSTGQTHPTAALVRLKRPLAPPVAAELEGVELQPERWIATIKELADSHDVVLVESGGGLLSPITWTDNAMTLVQKLSADVIVVAADRHGTLNHSLLTLLALESAGVTANAERGSRLLGVVFSEGYEADATTGKNADAFLKASGFHHVLTVPREAHWSAAVSHVQPMVDRIVG